MSPWPAVFLALLVAALVFTRRRAPRLAWMLSWLAAGVLGDAAGTLLNQAAERLLAAAHLTPQPHHLGLDTALASADLADLLVLGSTLWLLLALGRWSSRMRRP